MVLVIQPSLIKDSIPEGYDKIIVLYSDTDTFKAPVVKAMLETKNLIMQQIPNKADDIVLAYTIGAIAGENGGASNLTALIAGEKAKKSIAALGISTTPVSVKPRKPAAKKTATQTAKKSEPQTAKKQETVKEEVKPAAEPKTRKPASHKTRAAKAPVEKADFPMPAPVDDKSFDDILKECGVPMKYKKQIRQAVADAYEPISYEVRIRMNMPDNPDAQDIYEKTKGRFMELKEAL